MQILFTINNILIITIGFLLFLRLVLWYFKKDSPFLKEEWSISATAVLFLTVIFCNVISYSIHGFMIDRALYLCGVLYGVALVIVMLHYLMELREKLPDSRKNKNDSSYY